MEVLVAGGYGFIGSYVVEKFYREGHNVYIIDNLSTGKKENVKVKHKCFIENIDSPRCEEIFRSNHFDVVIDLCGGIDGELDKEYNAQSTKAGLSGLVQLLYLSQKYGVKKFLYASSVEVYGDNLAPTLNEQSTCKPNTTRGIDHLVSEYYCQKNITNELSIIILRLSEVYGPRQSLNNYDFIPALLSQNRYETRMTYFDGQDYFIDLIYVTDVSEAIYRAILSDVKGIYNLTANPEQNFYEQFSVLQKYMNLPHVNNQNISVKRVNYDNRKIIKDLDWVPFYTLEEGLTKTVAWKTNEENLLNKNQEKSERAKQRLLLKRLQYFIPFFENILLFLFLVLIDTSLSYQFYFIDLKLLYILIVGLIFGKNQAFISCSLTIGYYLYVQSVNGRDVVSILLDYTVLSQFALYLTLGLIVGYRIDKQNIKVMKVEAEQHSLKAKYDFLTEIYHDTRKVKEDLRKQIIHSEDGVGKIYNIVKRLDSLEPEDVFISAISVLQQTMKIDQVAIYIASHSKFLRLISKSNSDDFHLPASLKVEDSELLKKALNEQISAVNKDFIAGEPMIAAPIVKDDQTIAIVCLYNVKFENLTLYYQNLLQVVINLITASLGRAAEHVHAIHDQRYVDNSSLLKPKYLQKMIISKKNAKLQFDIPFTLLEVIVPLADVEKLNQIGSILRNTDHFGKSDDGRVWVLLSNTSIEDAKIVVDRIRTIVVDVRIVEEAEVYV
ncbi:NAD-dependent epimerase/dehydratase family protein [Bacillus sp. Marseille-P3661]|uniref:NAD-dependent epimerase/dehydratase family protein n=1 Tax=Bacillus sp. Marseille-P3661 TaxID=1936234 RepID=UPI000C82F165|nr:NAD(P)-dependent oxidoreductase [Bacillus sp. Marseille-P3661]